MSASPFSENLYIHVPFCDGKCSYCGFYSELYVPSRLDTYLAALALDMDFCLRSDPKPEPTTLYIGGGTPTVLNTMELVRLCKVILDRISDRHMREWTVEANPNTLTVDKLRVLADAGVNRISLGAQSFDCAALQAIGRRHSVSDIARAVEITHRAGIRNLGIDLIACLPGVEDRTWSETLDKTISFSPRHVSVYALSAEPDTELARQVAEGAMIMATEESQLRAIDTAAEMLESAGYRRYEISNYAQPGCECLHNLSCWRGLDYLGFGPSASSRIGTERWTNVRDLARYAAALSEGRRPIHEHELLGREADAAERLMFTFRLREGVNLQAFRGRIGVSAGLERQWEDTLRRLAQDDMTVLRNNRWSLTPAGMRVADSIAGEFAAL